MLFTLGMTALFQTLYYVKFNSTFVYENFDLLHFIYNLLCVPVGFFTEELSFNGPAWCIGIEVLLYIIFFGICSIGRHGKKQLFGSIMLLFSIGLVLSTFVDVHIPLLYRESMARGYICFAIGMTLGFCSLSNKKYYVFTSCMGFAILYGITAVISGQNMRLAYAMIVVPLLISICFIDNCFNKLITEKLSAICGNLSLNIYMLHFPLQIAMVLLAGLFGVEIEPNNPVFFVVYFMFVLICSIIVNKVFVAIKFIADK